MRFQVREFLRAAKRNNIRLTPGFTFSEYVNGKPTKACVVGVTLLTYGVTLLTYGLYRKNRNQLRQQLGEKDFVKLCLVENGFEGLDNIEKSVWDFREFSSGMSGTERRRYWNVGAKLRKLALS